MTGMAGGIPEPGMVREAATAMIDPIPCIADPADLTCARDLIAGFGADAAGVADARAVHARDVGNVTRFCRWRRVGRLVTLMAHPGAPGTIH